MVKNPEHDGYQRQLASIVYKLFDKKFYCFNTSGGAVTQSNKSTMSNEQLAEELHKPIIKKFEKWKVYSCFKDNV